MLLPLSQTHELSPNRQAFPLVQKFLSRSELLRVKVHKQNGVTVIDCGVHVQGGWEAGTLFASVCLGGLAQVQQHWSDFNGLHWPAVEVVSDHPIRACLASQYAGWPIKNGKLLAMGSGPGRAIVHEGEVFEVSGYEDYSETAIICLESEELPSEEVVRYILEECQCDPTNLYIMVAPTASQVGSVQIAARALETGLSKLMELGYNIENIVSGSGICPLSPVAGDNLSALGRTNDALLYGSTVLYYLHDDDKALDSLVKLVPSSSSREYGRPFAEVYKECGDFYDIDPRLFSPAEVWLCNLKSGNSFHAGSLRPDILRNSFGLGIN
ncbi:methenyltetrahydromethanopterin cyclohydrolase [Desulfosporosinus sp. Sb-LF]|uniref:methenyltetrahydromethanopterin cyclohydrolase n=1 Tax=Desulfosporosinus sp. Sb-LF TaxID=2560027 RepID=UPI00107FB31F|nr:methenyltetrahydromethanopterin cyclohydrolase [Desulfosporosinus sp. Sb-LF]TGE33522.1 methenyltetrahydromethanopterin cyclohydrolase [Desulfosporosinus sp. Sb-LF]